MQALEMRYRSVRRMVAAGCAVVAIGYLLTGSGVVPVTSDQPPGTVPPLLLAAGLFAVLALLSVRRGRRSVWVLGVVLQVMVLVMYVMVAADRTPPFEPWGVTLKVVQVGLLVAFGWLWAVGSRATATGEPPLLPTGPRST